VESQVLGLKKQVKTQVEKACAWCLVLSAWCLVLGAWSKKQGEKAG
jgi:hypothetical protein